MESTTKTRSLNWSELAIPFAIYFSVCALTISRVPSTATDSMNYINRIDSGKQLLHPHHLLFNVFGWIWVGFWRRLGLQADTAILVSLLDAIFGALCLCVFYRLLRTRVGYNRGSALLATGLPAFSFGFWYYSASVEVYIIPLFLLLLSFSLLTGEYVDAKTFALVGFLNGLAVLFAEMSVLFATVVFLTGWFRYRDGDIKWTKSAASYLLFAVPTAAVPYTLATFVAGNAHSVQSAYRWLTDYVHYPRFWAPLALSSVLKACIGLGQAFVGSHFLFALPNARHWVQKMLPDFNLAHEAFLVRNLGSGIASVLVALVAAQLLVVIYQFARRLQNWTLFSITQKRFVYLLAVWFLTYGTFTFFYMSVNSKFWIAPTLCLWLIFLVFFAPSQPPCDELGPRSIVVLAIAVGLSFLVNYFGTIRFTRDQANDYYYCQVKALLEFTRPGDLVVIGTSGKYKPYLLRYGKTRVLSLTSVYETSGATPESVQSVKNAIDDELATGGRVLISQEALEPEFETVQQYPEIIAFHPVLDGYRERWHARGSPTNVGYLLDDARQQEIRTGSDGIAETLHRPVVSSRFHRNSESQIQGSVSK